MHTVPMLTPMTGREIQLCPGEHISMPERAIYYVLKCIYQCVEDFVISFFCENMMPSFDNPDRARQWDGCNRDHLMTAKTLITHVATS